MVWIKRFFAIIVFLLMLIFLVSFTASNSGMVKLELFGWSTLPFKISSLLITAFILGGLAGLAVSLLSLVRLRLKNAACCENWVEEMKRSRSSEAVR